MSESNPFLRQSYLPEDNAGTALQRFLESMKIDFYKWHDGIGYDLDALNELKRDEIRQVEELLISRKDSDWRDVEALATLNTPFTIQALRDCLNSSNLDCRLFAVRYLKEMGIADHIEEVVVKTLPETKIGTGMSFALDLVEKYPSERLRQLVLRCAFLGNDDIRVHCAALALFLYSKTPVKFDSDQKIIFKFHEKDLSVRMDSFARLCEKVGVDPIELLK